MMHSALTKAGKGHMYDQNRDFGAPSGVYGSIGNGFNRCAWRIHDIKGGLLTLSVHHAHLSNYTGEVAQVCHLQPVINIYMTGCWTTQSTPLADARTT